MSYHIYSTDGIVLKRTPYGEANVLVHILTRDLGLIMASAQSLRQLQSKLRGALQEFSLVSVSCIKGKRGWKVTDGRAVMNFFFISNESATTRTLLARIASLLLQMIPGEEIHPEIFEIVLGGFTFLEKTKAADIQNFETLFVLRILYQLGYVVKDSLTEAFLSTTTEWDADLLEKVGESRIQIVKIINTGLTESHLT